MKRKPARDRATLLAVAKELRESAKANRQLATRHVRGRHWGICQELDDRAVVLKHWADHFEAQAKR